VSRLTTVLVLMVVGVAALTAAAPTLSKLAASLTAPIVAAGGVACLVRIVWARTRRW
jgi:hypothetical protein